ncbi:MAG: glycyl-radical enzyme activating protein [Clostridia bacterium]|nr:glycyl-radical enzyme activating protein [Clostridia bacterium]
MNGLIFDIQRFSVHDGPGIRTTVFMKGCPLRCKWCHNPEGLNAGIQLQFFDEKCIGCGSCGNRANISDAEKCPAEALVKCGREIDEDELIRELLKDRDFYGNNGGVTFSGGECMLQADFVASVLKKIKSLGISTAIDTSGYVPWASFEKTLDCCELYLYDIKCFTSSVHKEYTGVDNMLIIDNIKRLSEAGKSIWIRVPVIPDFNNNEDEMTAIAELAASLKTVEQVTLMPYHTLGASKYKTLGLEYPYDTNKKITEEEMDSFRKIFIKRNITLA